MEQCEHQFKFLRKDEVYESGYRPGRDVFDIYFCEKCLTYRKVFVQHEEQSRERFGYEVTRKAI